MLYSEDIAEEETKRQTDPQKENSWHYKQEEISARIWILAETKPKKLTQ